MPSIALAHTGNDKTENSDEKVSYGPVFEAPRQKSIKKQFIREGIIQFPHKHLLFALELMVSRKIYNLPNFLMRQQMSDMVL